MKQVHGRRPIFIFDIGGVVIIWRSNDPIFKYISKKYDVPFTKMRIVMNRILPELETGKITSKQFVQKSLARFGKKLSLGDDPSRLITIPFSQKAKSRKGVIKIIRGLQGRGHKVIGFSNTNRVHVRFMEQSGWTNSLFDRFFASCELGIMKPDPKAYRKVLNEIHAKPNDVLFIDDTERNVLGAKSAGIINSIKFHSILDLKKKIERAILVFD